MHKRGMSHPGIHSGKLSLFSTSLLLLPVVMLVIVPGSTASPSSTSSREILKDPKEFLVSSQGSHFAPQVTDYLPEEDKADAQLPSLVDELNFNNFNKPQNNAYEETNHIISKRQVRNDYERFYLCVFSLFTNPNCNQNLQNNVDRQSDYNGNSNNYNNNYNTNNDYGASSTTNTGYVPLFQGLFGQNQNQRFGLFGNRYQNGNNFYPYQTPATYAPFVYPTTIQTTRRTTTTAPTTARPVMSDYPAISQSPYPDPQVNRRPGPESLQNKSPPVTSTFPSPSTSTTSKPTAAVAVTVTPLNKVQSGTRLTFVPPSGKNPSSSEVLKQQDQSKFQQDEDTQIVFTGDTTNKPPSTSRITEKYDPNCVNGTSTTEGPKVPATFPILEFGEIQAQATTPSNEINDGSSVSMPPKDPMKDPEYFKLKLKIQELERSNNALKVFYSDLAKKTSQLQTELNATTELSEKLKKENAALKFSEGESQEQLGSFQTQSKYLQEALATVKDEGSKLKQRISQLERTNNHLQQTNGQLQHGNSDQRIQINELKTKVKYLEDKVIRMTAENYAKHLMETRELRDKIKRLENDYLQCRHQLYEMQRKGQQVENNSNKNKYSDSNDFNKRLGIAESVNTNINNSSEEIVIEASVEDETERNTEMPTAIPGIVFQDEEIVPTVSASGENSTEVSSSETTGPSIVEFNLPSKVQQSLNTQHDSVNSTNTSHSNETQMEILVLPDQVPSNFPFGSEFTSGVEVPGLDPSTLGLALDPDFDVRMGDVGVTGNGAITFGDNEGVDGGVNTGMHGQSVYGQYPFFNFGQGYQSVGHDSPWRHPFYPGAFSSLTDNLGYGQNEDFIRRQL